MKGDMSTPKVIPVALLVEDDVEIAGILEEGLRTAGYKVVLAHTARDAIQKLARQHFHCVIVDLQLKNERGEDVVINLRSFEDPRKDTPVVVMSAFLDRDVVRNLTGSVQAVLVKPFTVETFVQRVTIAAASSLPAGAAPILAMTTFRT